MTPLESMVDLWPRFFTDFVTICRIRRTSRAFGALKYDFGATSCIHYINGVPGVGGNISPANIFQLHNHIYCGEKCRRMFGDPAKMPTPCCGHEPVATISFNTEITGIFAHPLHRTTRIAAEAFPGPPNLADVKGYAGKIAQLKIAAPNKKCNYDYTIIIDGNKFKTYIPADILADILAVFTRAAVEYF